MPRDLCRLVPALAIVCVLASGCSRSHDGDGERVCDCCGTPVTIGASETCTGGACDPHCGFPFPDGGGGDAGARDASIPDAARPDSGPLECPPHAIDLACDVDALRAGTPQLLPVRIGARDRCYCGESIECRATLVGPRTLALDTGLCAEGPLCDACFPFVEGTCALPALESGTWQVELNGQPGFELPVLEAGVAPEWGETCVRRGEALAICPPAWPPAPTFVDQACVPTEVQADTAVPIDLTNTCASACNALGPCKVDIFDDVIRVTPTSWNPSCDVSCPAVCELREEICYTPPLPAGTWRVFIEGYDTALFTIRSTTSWSGEPSVTCAGASSGG